MRVSIGILAWNEAAMISRTVQSLFAQTLLAQPRADVHAVEVVCVPNGCTDETATIAQRMLADCAARCTNRKVTWRVCEVETPGKSNAWNRYVHEFADPAADYLFLMDADIWSNEPETLWLMVRMLEAAPCADLAVDTPMKHIALKSRKGLLDKASLAISELSKAGPAKVCGQLYCGRSRVLRAIWMPIDLTLEDNFVHRMVVTGGLTHEADFDRIVSVPGASHVFEAYTHPRDVFRHEKTIAIGSHLNAILYEWLTAQLRGEDAGAFIKRQNEQDPQWYVRMLREQIASRGGRLIPHVVSLRRFRRLRTYPWPRKVLWFPVALGTSMLDCIVGVVANRTVRKSATLYLWEKTRKE